MTMLCRFSQASNLILQPSSGTSSQVSPTTPRSALEKLPSNESSLPHEAQKPLPVQNGCGDNDIGKTLEDFEKENLEVLKQRESKKKVSAKEAPKVLKRPAKCQAAPAPKKAKQEIGAKSKAKHNHTDAKKALGCGKCRGQGCATCRLPGFKGALYTREQWLARAKVMKLK